MHAAQNLDRTFAALADPTRRAILKRLARGAATVAELCRPFAISQPAISRHLKVLEAAGLVESGKAAQARPRRLVPGALAATTAWADEVAAMWSGSLDRLDDFLKSDAIEKGPTDGR